MMKKTDKEYIQESLDKWVGFKEDVREQVEQEYRYRYWIGKSCGYCKIVSNDCDNCSLHKGVSRKYGIRYCWNYYIVGNSIASRAVELADKREWQKAEEYADILIAKMKRDLRKLNKSEYDDLDSDCWSIGLVEK